MSKAIEVQVGYRKADGRDQAIDTLAFSARTGVRSMNETFPLERASEAYERMMSGKARFRVVLKVGD